MGAIKCRHGGIEIQRVEVWHLEVQLVYTKKELGCVSGKSSNKQTSPTKSIQGRMRMRVIYYIPFNVSPTIISSTFRVYIQWLD